MVPQLTVLFCPASFLIFYFSWFDIRLKTPGNQLLVILILEICSPTIPTHNKETRDHTQM
jgi:hypothetical protein